MVYIYWGDKGEDIFIIRFFADHFRMMKYYGINEWASKPLTEEGSGAVNYGFLAFHTKMNTLIKNSIYTRLILFEESNNLLLATRVP